MPFELPPLPYDKAALEPHFDALTMEIHHDKRHAAYVANLNKAIAGQPALEGKSLEALIGDLASVPDAIRGPVRNNGGGHWNHSFFWKILAPKAGGAPSGKSEIADERFERLAFERGVAGDGLVEIGDVSRVMFVVMDLHRQRVKVGFERGFIVGQGREFKWHRFNLVKV